MQQELVKNFVMVKCSDPRHTNCAPLRKEIVKLNNVIEAYTTRAKVGDSVYCIAVTATSTPQGIRNLEKEIRKVKERKHNLSVVDVKIFQDQR